MEGFINGIARDGVPVQVVTRLAIHGATLGILEAVHLVDVVDPAGSLVDDLPDCLRRLLNVRAVGN
jgi:hypothetical protein